MTNLFKRIKQYRNKRFYSKLISNNDVCFDIGANKGMKSELFLSLGAKVLAFEPQSKCKKHLIKIKHKNFKYFSIAVGAKDEIKELNIANHIEVATFSSEFIKYFKNDTLYWNYSEKVEVKKLDTLIDEHGIPDFCKIDVEGYELEILANLNHNISIIEFEFTGGFIPNTIKIIKLLNKNNTLYNYNLNEIPKFELINWVKVDEIVNIINDLPINRLHGNIFVKNK